MEKQTNKTTHAMYISIIAMLIVGFFMMRQEFLNQTVQHLSKNKSYLTNIGKAEKMLKKLLQEFSEIKKYHAEEMSSSQKIINQLTVAVIAANNKALASEKNAKKLEQATNQFQMIIKTFSKRMYEIDKGVIRQELKNNGISDQYIKNLGLGE